MASLTINALKIHTAYSKRGGLTRAREKKKNPTKHGPIKEEKMMGELVS